MRIPARTILPSVSLSVILLSVAYAQSPPAQATVAVGGKKLTIEYSAPSVHGRQIFGPGGLLSGDPTYPAWRAGANSATAFHSDANLDIGGLAVPKGDYTLYCWVEDPNQWQLIINKETGQWGLSYNRTQDLGRIKMTMSKPPAPVETLKYTLTAQGGNKAQLQLAWENHVATVPITVK
ncbi:MAG: DUF2911 domain-containing protein [Acidobacteriia bacterium]|nr:DUF2911 domain-containing protein [Terriglobia bacterium]